MGRRRTTIAGRRDELDVLNAALVDVARRGRLLVLRGPAGIGKSTLLDAAAQAWRSNGIRVIYATFRDTAGAADTFGFQTIVDAARDHFEQVGGAQLAASIGRLSQLCAAMRAAPDGDRIGAVLEVGTMFDVISVGRATVLVADNADAVPAPAVALRAAARPGCLIVAACRDGDTPAAAELGVVSDEVVGLPPLPDDSVAAMLAQVEGAQLDDGLLLALRSALGPLAGNPETVLSTMDDLRRGGRLAVPRGVSARPRGHLCLVDPHIPIALPAEHELVARVRALGPLGVRLATTAAIIRFGVDDVPLLADAMRGEVDRYGEMIDRLVSSGVLTIDALGGLGLTCAALAARLVQDVGSTGVARLHRAHAAALLRRIGHGQAADVAALADHVTSAGPTIPADRRNAAMLVDAAAGATDDEPARVARWLRAALWHAGEEPIAAQILGRLLRLLVRTGQYRRLGEVVHTSAATDGVPREDLAAAAMLAAVHAGAPPKPAVVDALIAGSRGPLDFCASWFTANKPVPPTIGRARAAVGADTDPPLLTTEELATVAGALWTRQTDPAETLTDPMLAAGSVGDLAMVFALVLGPRYGSPADGALAAYRRLLDAYGGGDFTAALSAARELELSGPAVTPAHNLARVFAAVMHSARGDAKRAAGWLEAVPNEPPYLAMRWWAAHGQMSPWDSSADPGAALRDGWLAYRRQREHGSRIGVEELLGGMAEVAVWSGLDDDAATLLAEVDALRAGPGLTAETFLMVQALVGRDPAAAHASADLARARGHRPRLMRICLAAATLDDEPRQWLLEAYDLAKSFGSAELRAGMLAQMREYGISSPRSPTPREAFSSVETQIIELIRAGWTNRQIASKMRVSEKTVEKGLTRLFARTGCRSRVELATASLARGGLGATSDRPELF